MTTYRKVGSVKIQGKKKNVYMKDGSQKKYVSYKGRKMNLTKYKKMKQSGGNPPDMSGGKRKKCPKKIVRRCSVSSSSGKRTCRKVKRCK